MKPAPHYLIGYIFIFLLQGCSEDQSCDKWTFEIPRYIGIGKDTCVEIPCTFTHPEDAKDFNFFWYLVNSQAKIFNNKTPSDVAEEYKGRTFLTGNTGNDCSIKIIDVEKTDYYYPGINDDINSYKLKNNKKIPTYVTVHRTDEPPKPLISGIENIKDKKTVNISCSVWYSCSSTPPTLTWNITGHPIVENHKDLRPLGGWKMESIMTYTASYTDDKTLLQCAATFPNKVTSVKIITLNIKYSPKNVIVSVIGNKTKEGDNTSLLCSGQANPAVSNYTWYKVGEARHLLQEGGATIQVHISTEDRYLCIAHNEMGTQESLFFQFSEEYNPSTNYVYFAFIGIICLCLLALIIYFCWRKKTFHRPQSPQPSDSTTYTSLKKREIQDEYATLEPVPPGGSNTQGRDLSKNADYENIRGKT